MTTKTKSRMAQRSTLVLCAVTVAAALCAASASAKIVHPSLLSFGSFLNVQGVAVDAGGDVYVLDAGESKVYKFNASGEPANFGATGTNAISGVGAGGSDENEIAVDDSSGPAKGDIYVANGSSQSVLIYSSTGSQIGELSGAGNGGPWNGEKCGVAVDPSGDVYVGMYGNHVDKFVPKANPVRNADFASSIGGIGGICNVAVDSAGNVFADTWSSGPVKRYEPSQFGSLSATGSTVDMKGSTLAVDPANNEVYVDEQSQIAQFGAHGEPFEAPVMTFAGESAIGGSFGIAVSPVSRDIYVSNGKGQVSVFGPAADLPTVTTGEASGITHTEATISGSVNPEGIAVTSCQFEYGTGTSYGHTVPCPTSPGSGNAPVEETVALSGLEPSTIYHYRLAVSTANGPSASADRTFATAIVWPETATGLPDGRVYEEVSPANKYGNEVSYTMQAFVSSDGQAVLYGTTGAIIKGASNGVFFPSFVSERTSNGWTARSVVPLPYPGEKAEEENVEVRTAETLEAPSADLSHLLFGTWGKKPYVGPPDESQLNNNFFLEGPDPFAEPQWIARSQIQGAPGGTGMNTFSNFYVAGTSPDLKTIYFFYEATLFPGASHLYEYREGVLSDTGRLPGGESSTGMAMPAAQDPQLNARFGHNGLPAPAGFDNQVSEDGSRIFFVRQDEAGKLELYARVTAPNGSQSTVLISQSQLAGHLGEPAPGGPLAVSSTERQSQGSSRQREALGVESWPSFVFASPDGSHAFFQSADRLTDDAPQNSAAKTYGFDLETGKLAYLPAITGPIVTVGADGSWLIFENTTHNPFQLERWAAGANGGSASPIAALPSVPSSACGQLVCVGPAYTSADGKVVVFATDSPIPGFNDGGSHREINITEFGEFPRGGLLHNWEIFRYEAEGNRLSCISCPPKGVTPASDAIMSPLDFYQNGTALTGATEAIAPGRAVSSDGSRVFFETRDALVPQDTNGTADVYEWEDGKLFLISSGHSTDPAYLLGTSESGADVFFLTTEGIAPGDKDGSYDVYDARIPRPGDVPPPEAIPCEGAVCQGPPSVPNLLGQPASEAFNGLGNLTPTVPSSHPGVKSLTRAQRLAGALKACGRYKSARKRERCERQTRHRYRARGARVDGQTRHGKGRGK